jgi:phosphopantothenoylcysteine decarboxylase/phosphopantothenate--cysteine ligase
LKKSADDLTLKLVPTVDILAQVAKMPRPPFCVGFAAESENVVDHARKKREKKGIPLIVANHAGAAIGADDNEVTLIDGTNEVKLARAPKAQIADAIVARAAELFCTTRLRDGGTQSTTNHAQPKNA